MIIIVIFLSILPGIIAAGMEWRKKRRAASRPRQQSTGRLTAQAGRSASAGAAPTAKPAARPASPAAPAIQQPTAPASSATRAAPTPSRPAGGPIRTRRRAPRTSPADHATRRAEPGKQLAERRATRGLHAIGKRNGARPATRPARAPRPQSCPRWSNATTSAASATEQTTDSSGRAHWRKAREATGGIATARGARATTSRARRRAGRSGSGRAPALRSMPSSFSRPRGPRAPDGALNAASEKSPAARPADPRACMSRSVSASLGSSTSSAAVHGPIPLALDGRLLGRRVARPAAPPRRRRSCPRAAFETASSRCGSPRPRCPGSTPGRREFESNSLARAKTRSSASCAASSASAGRRCRPDEAAHERPDALIDGVERIAVAVGELRQLRLQPFALTRLHLSEPNSRLPPPRSV